MSFESVCADHGATESPKHKRGYLFADRVSAQSAVTALGFQFPLFELSPERHVTLYINKHRKLVISAERLKGEPTIQHWVNGTRFFEAVVGGLTDEEAPEEQNWDDRFRWVDVQTGNGRFEGDQYRAKVNIGEEDEHWSKMGAQSVRCMLQAAGLTRTEADCAMGRMHINAWTLVRWPFQPEYPAVAGKRIWNPDAPRLRYEPVAGPHPHWDRIFEHIGREMDAVLPGNAWARSHNTTRGSDWLRLLYASIVRQPKQPTPYLFLFGEEDDGKSILHEAFDLLVTGGVVKADRALTSKSDFCGELDGAILCVVEEKDLSKSSGALAKIKDAVTALKLSIRRMRTDSYMIDNMTHWIQCANKRDACVVNPGCTRIQTLHVGKLIEKIPKEKLVEALTAEGPAITHTLLNLVLPEPEGRLALQLIETPSRILLSHESVHEFVMEVASFAYLGGWPEPSPIQAGDWDRGDWRGTAPELANALNDVQQYPDAPRDLRRTEKLLEENSKYLRSRGVAHTISEKKTKKGRTITLTLLETPPAT